jgi:2,3-bisphosphoglycerate-independent phosphoglycerate mutase
VPVILVDEERKRSRLKEGTAIDVAPTVLQLLELPQPSEMTGHSLITDS